MIIFFVCFNEKGSCFLTALAACDRDFSWDSSQAMTAVSQSFPYQNNRAPFKVKSDSVCACVSVCHDHLPWCSAAAL